MTEPMIGTAYYRKLLKSAQRMIATLPRMTLTKRDFVQETVIALLRDNPSEFLNDSPTAYAEETLRHKIVDHLRRRRAEKRGGGQTTMPLDDAQVAAPGDPGYFDPFADLRVENRRAATAGELIYFQGLSQSEAAAEMGLGQRTVQRAVQECKEYFLPRLGRQGNG